MKELDLKQKVETESDLASVMNKKEVFSLWGRRVQESSHRKKKKKPSIYLGSCIPQRASDHYMVCSFSSDRVVTNILCFAKEHTDFPPEICFNSRGEIGFLIIQDNNRDSFSKIYPCDFGHLKVDWNGERVEAWFTIKETRPFDMRRYSRPYRSGSKCDFGFVCGGESFQVEQYLDSVDLFLEPIARPFRPNPSAKDWKVAYRMAASLGDARRLTWKKQLQLAFDFLKEFHDDLLLLRDRYSTEYKSIYFYKIVPKGSLGKGILGGPMDHPGTIPDELRVISEELGVDLITRAVVK